MDKIYYSKLKQKKTPLAAKYTISEERKGVETAFNAKIHLFFASIRCQLQTETPEKEYVHFTIIERMKFKQDKGGSFHMYIWPTLVSNFLDFHIR